MGGIAKNVRERSRELNLSTQELADLASLPYRTVNSIMTGESQDPRASTIKKIAIALGTTADKLLFDDGESEELLAMIREFDTLDRDKQEYAKKVLRAILIQTKNEQLQG